MDFSNFNVKAFVALLAFYSHWVYIWADEQELDLDHHPNWSNLPVDTCGNAKFSNRIYGGTRANLGKYPWMALLQYLNFEKYLDFDCGGTLISSLYVITAAHCKPGRNHTLVRVRLGENYLDRIEDCENGVCAPPVQDIDVKQMILHPKYDDDKILNDIALVVLNNRAVFNDFVQPVCLPRGSVMTKNFTMAEVAGWGQIGEDNYEQLHSNGLLYISVPINALEFCKEYYSRELNESQICAGGIKGQDSCSGDSGGPLMRPMSLGSETPRYYLLGVTSFGKRICGEKPALYSRVASFMDWILNNIDEK